MSRAGSVYKRCTACRRRVADRKCPCGHGRHTWTFTVDVNPPGAKRRQVSRGGFDTKAEAVTAMQAEQVDRTRGVHVEPSTLSVRRYAEETFGPGLDARVKAGSLRPNTRDDYARILRRHILPGIGDIPIQRLRPSDLERLYGEVSEHLSAKTISNIARLIHLMLEVALDDGLVPRNVAARARAPKVEQKERPTLVPEQLGVLLTWMQERDPEYHPIVVLYATTGLRRGEVLGLCWSDLDFENAFARLEQQVTTVRGRPVVAPLKSTRSRRTVPLHPAVVAVLREHRRVQAVRRLALGSAWRDHGLVFPRDDGQPRRPATVNSHLTDALAAAGLPHITVHDIRHSAASTWLDRGVAIPTVSALLGHASPAITMRVYAHQLEGRDRDASNALGDAILHPRSVSNP